MCGSPSKQLSWACTQFVGKSWITRTVHFARELYAEAPLDTVSKGCIQRDLSKQARTLDMVGRRRCCLSGSLEYGAERERTPAPMRFHNSYFYTRSYHDLLSFSDSENSGTGGGEWAKERERMGVGRGSGESIFARIVSKTCCEHPVHTTTNLLVTSSQHSFYTIQ